MFRLAVKVGLASGAVYYINQEGVWRESSEALKTYDRLGAALEPYVGQLKKQLPFEIPTIPKEERSYEVAKEYWNKGVIATFGFLSELPCKSTEWVQGGVVKILNNPEVKKVLEGNPETKSSQ